MQVSLPDQGGLPGRHSFRFKAITLMTCSAAALSFGQPALADSSAEDAYRAYIAELADLGIKSTNSGLSYDASADRLTVHDEKWVFEGTFSVSDATEENPDAQKLISYKIEYASEATTIDGLTEKNGAYSADKWSLSDDTKLIFSGAIEGEGRGQMAMRLKGYQIDNYSFDLPDVPPENADKMVSRWLPFLRSFTLQSYDEMLTEATGGTLEIYTGPSDTEVLAVQGTIQMDGYRVENFKNGVADRYSIDTITQTFMNRHERTDQMLTQTTVQTGKVYEQINVSALLDLFDPGVAASDEKTTIIGSQKVGSYVSTQDIGKGLAVQMKFGETSLTNLYAMKRDFDFLGFLDRLAAGEEPKMQDVILGVLQLYRSFGIESATLQDLSILAPVPQDPQEEIKLTIDEVSLNDISSDRIGEMKLVNAAAPVLPDGAGFSLKTASIGNIEFADFDSMSGVIAQLADMPALAQYDPLLIARTFAPYSLSVAAEGLEISVPNSGDMSLKSYALDLSTVVPPIPTSIFSKTEEMTLRVDGLQDEEAREILEAMGLETVTWSDETVLNWNEKTLDLTLEKLVFSVKELGTFEGSFKFGNVARAALEDPQGQGQLALAMANFVGAKFAFVDAGGTEKALAVAAEDGSVSVGELKVQMTEEAVNSVAALNNAAFSEMVRIAVSDFLADPGTLTVSLKPVKSVPITQILGSIAAPQVLPELLNIQVSAQ